LFLSSFIINQDDMPHPYYTYVYSTLVSNHVIIRARF